ncbi:zinc finger protein ZAT8 [Brachypodium distachyon]|uniref:C2H2-type domain-containing protein n=1 Tax=Brachypodium distachyon TaxID=15368 RepID=I1GLK3_BRADI|nr:zinc finger protein ZAT8 [Brachypodium distachyon]KQK12443.1 hypothetical protein BRADI_1g03780v3 [Brachypodium distachyon]|eukprot:XP_003563654.1 zinc finger protein ZAT8 [Brachypodium distachyon]
MKHMTRDFQSEVAAAVPLSLSLSLGAMAAERKIKKLRHRTAGGAGESFVCKTCSRAFASFQALGGHRTSHLRGRHGLALSLSGSPPPPPPRKSTEQKNSKPSQQQQHECHVCGAGFEMGQALGGHMRRHREEAAAQAQAPPVLLQLFV